MNQIRKWMFAAVTALTLAAPFVTAAPARAEGLYPADPHGGGGGPVVRTWVTYEVHITAHNPRIGVDYSYGFTYNEYNDGYGHYTYEGWNEFVAFLNQLTADGIGYDAWQAYPIAEGTW
jgi:hypothetical protein